MPRAEPFRRPQMRDGQFAGINQVDNINGYFIDSIAIYFFQSFRQKFNVGSAIPSIDYKKIAYLAVTAHLGI
jgi:hypothetical protein